MGEFCRPDILSGLGIGIFLAEEAKSTPSKRCSMRVWR
jgi:hypothetical protein